MAAHRYWRFSPTNENGGYNSISEIRFQDASGNQPAFSQAISSPNYYDQGPAATQDNNVNTFWASNQPNPWVGVDFGDGVTVDVQTIALTSRGDGYDSQTPTGGSVDWSDDGENWTQNHIIAAQENWGQGETRIISAVPAGPPMPAVNQLAVVVPAQYAPGSSIPSVEQMAVVVVASVTPPIANVQVDQLAVVIAAYAPPYVPPPVVIKLPCLSYCLPLYYIKEDNYVVQ